MTLLDLPSHVRRENGFGANWYLFEWLGKLNVPDRNPNIFALRILHEPERFVFIPE